MNELIREIENAILELDIVIKSMGEDSEKALYWQGKRYGLQIALSFARHKINNNIE